jgi:hypothetical protein
MVRVKVSVGRVVGDSIRTKAAAPKVVEGKAKGVAKARGG